MPSRRISADADADLVVAIYVNARLRIEQLIRAADARGATGTAAFLRQQRAALTAVLRDLEAARPALVAQAIRNAYFEGATIADAVLSPAEPFAAGAQARFFGAHEAAVAALAGELDGRLKVTQGVLGRSAEDAIARILREQVQTGVAGGLTRRQVSGEIVQEALREGITGLVDKRGARWSIDTYAETAARTMTREAVTLGTANRSLELGQDLVTISVHANACDICLPFQGRTFSLTGDTPGYPVALILPPYHPRCRHVATPAQIFDAIGRRRPGGLLGPGGVRAAA